jgi:glyoxylase-like metal-dependent hydrolase (beta-lactamase superfamily II)
MKHLAYLAAAASAAALVCAQPSAAQGTRGADRLYIMDCGQGVGPDQSRWSPGVNVGKPLPVSDNCYLIHHPQGWFLWDTGVRDEIAALPNGEQGQNGAPNWRRPKTLISQLDELGVKPADIKYLAVSHTHPDHIGNVELFPQTTLLVQKAEYDWPLPNGAPRFKPEHPVIKLEGDRDVFGDGTVMLFSTPGHTPGHQSLLVKLPKTGTLVLTGDAVHFKDNWDNRRVPAQNTDKDKTLASMQRIADFLTKEQAKLWINHDKVQSDTLKHSPEFYD